MFEPNSDLGKRLCREIAPFSKPNEKPHVKAIFQWLTEFGAPGRTRTSDTRFRKPVLYPLSYGGDRCIVRGQSWRRLAVTGYARVALWKS